MNLINIFVKTGSSEPSILSLYLTLSKFTGHRSLMNIIKCCFLLIHFIINNLLIPNVNFYDVICAVRRKDGWFCVAGYTPCTALQYVIFTSCNVVLRRIYVLYCNDDSCVKDSAVHHSHQQSLVAKWLGLGVYS